MSDVPVDYTELNDHLNAPKVTVEASAERAASEFVFTIGNLKEENAAKRVISGNAQESLIREEALRIGAIEGNNARANEISRSLDALAPQLDVIFDFSRFVVKGRVLVPSVLASNAVFDQISETTQAEVQASFSVIEEAELVYTAPTFRNYLEVALIPEETIHYLLKPKSASEKRLWHNSFKEGWKAGYHKVSGEFHDGLMEMHEDFIGRATYMMLVDRNLMNPVLMSVKENGITYTGRTMNVGETVYSITANTTFASPQGWRAVWEVSNEFHELQQSDWIKSLGY